MGFKVCIHPYIIGTNATLITEYLARIEFLGPKQSLIGTAHISPHKLCANRLCNSKRCDRVNQYTTAKGNAYLRCNFCSNSHVICYRLGTNGVR